MFLNILATLALVFTLALGVQWMIVSGQLSSLKPLRSRMMNLLRWMVPLPVDATFQCAGPALSTFDTNLKAITYTDNCDEGPILAAVDIGIDETFGIPGCQNKFTRKYTLSATDSCSNTAADTLVTATVSDTEGPTLTCSGAGSSIDFDLCAGGMYPAGYTTVTTVDTCDGTNEVTIESAPTCCTDAAHAVVTRTWNFKDSCGNEATVPCTQQITSTGETCAGA
jgi:hypothetical protein